MAHTSNAQKPSDRRRKELPKIENIIESYGQYVYNLALKLSANPEYADDLTQETFIKAWLHIKELRSPEAIKKWLRNNLYQRVSYIITQTTTRK